MNSVHEETPEQDVTREEEVRTATSEVVYPQRVLTFLIIFTSICSFSRTPHYWPHRPKMDKPNTEQMWYTIILVYFVNSTIFKISKLGHVLMLHVFSCVSFVCFNVLS